jgi:hypothetical protein
MFSKIAIWNAKKGFNDQHILTSSDIFSDELLVVQKQVSPGFQC